MGGGQCSLVVISSQISVFCLEASKQWLTLPLKFSLREPVGKKLVAALKLPIKPGPM